MPHLALKKNNTSLTQWKQFKMFVLGLEKTLPEETWKQCTFYGGLTLEVDRYDFVIGYWPIFNASVMVMLYHWIDFRIKMMSGSSLPPVVCMRAHV